MYDIEPCYSQLPLPPGPAVWGLATMLATAVLNPSLGAWADQTDRCKVVTLGVLAQVGRTECEWELMGKTGKTTWMATGWP